MNKKLTEYRERIKTISDEMGPLADKEERTADEESRLDALLAEFNDLGEKATREAGIQGALDKAKERDEPQRRLSGMTSPGEQRDGDEREIDRRSIGQRFAESEEVKGFRGGRSAPVEVRSFYHRHQPLAHADGMTPQEVRTLVHTGALPSEFIQPQFVSGIFRPDEPRLTVRDAIINGQTTSDTIHFFRETSFTNNAAAVAQATATTGATGLKPESGLALEEASESVVTLAHWIPITRQTIQDAAQMQTYVEGRLLDGLARVEDSQLLNGDGTGANMTGLRETTGVQLLNNGVSPAYWADNPAAGAGTQNENFNRILRAKTLARTVAGATANFLIINPTDIEQFLTRTDANNQYFGAGPFSAAGLPPLWGLRVIDSDNQPAGEAFVGDGRMAAVWDRMQAQILIDTINDQFVRNMLTILAEERLALTVFRPIAFLRVELAAWT